MTSKLVVQIFSLGTSEPITKELVILAGAVAPYLYFVALRSTALELTLYLRLIGR